MENETTQTTLRETLESAFDDAEKQPVQETPIVAENIATETSEQKEARERDERGRFVAKQPPNEPEPKAEAIAPTAQPVEIKRPARPSSWKKEMWEHWDKLDPNVANYVLQREQEFSKGVSTYKQEWEQAKPLLEAIAPFNAELQQHGINPSQWIQTLGNAHRVLALGNPDQKLSMFLKLAQDYKIPMQQLFTQGQDGKVYYNPQVQPFQTPPPPQQDVRAVVKQLMQEEAVQREVQQFSADAKQYPHFEQVRETMAGLLQAGLTQDLHSAYEAAIRMPSHSDIWDQLQQQDEAKKREQAGKLVASARAKAVSPRSSTPAGTGKSTEGKGLRSMLEEAYDEHISARV